MNDKSILYIEDEEDYQLLAQRILGKAGFHVTVADTGAEGVRLLHELRPDLLLLDINLPDTDGYKICQQLRQEFDFVVIDSPAGIEQGFRNAIVGADEIVIVANPEMASVRDADRIIGLVEAAYGHVP